MKPVSKALVLSFVVLVVAFGFYYLFSNVIGVSGFEQQLYAEGDGNYGKPDFNLVVLTDDVVSRLDSKHPTDVFSSVIDSISYVFHYNPQSNVWDWYDFGDSSGFLTEIVPGEYYVYVIEDCLLVI